MIITQTPLRVSFFGGGTDLPGFYEKHGGAVLSTTIDKYIYIIVKPRYDDLIVLNYSERESVERVADIRHNIFREALKYTGVDRGVEITSIGDIPSSGSGLGSSSSFTVGLLNALYAYLDDAKGPAELAEAACTIEIGVLGEPIGKQDQYGAAFGGVKRFIFHRNGAVEVQPLHIAHEPLLALQRSCRMFYTNRARKASSVLSDQKARIDDTSDSLKLMAKMAYDADDDFLSGNVAAIGTKLNQAWLEKKKLSNKVSDAGIDSIYDAGIAAGAYGGKLLGAGGGGFFLFLCPPERLADLRKAMGSLKELPITFSHYGTKIMYSFEEKVYPLA
jgi:D-glycero-alpha-D-manno-heptose-7-phosphate kinase